MAERPRAVVDVQARLAPAIHAHLDVVARIAALADTIRLSARTAHSESVEAMLRSLKGFKLLDGYRGAPKADVAAAAKAPPTYRATEKKTTRTEKPPLPFDLQEMQKVVAQG